MLRFQEKSVGVCKMAGVFRKWIFACQIICHWSRWNISCVIINYTYLEMYNVPLLVSWRPAPFWFPIQDPAPDFIVLNIHWTLTLAYIRFERRNACQLTRYRESCQLNILITHRKLWHIGTHTLRRGNFSFFVDLKYNGLVMKKCETYKNIKITIDKNIVAHYWMTRASQQSKQFGPSKRSNSPACVAYFSENFHYARSRRATRIPRYISYNSRRLF